MRSHSTTVALLAACTMGCCSYSIMAKEDGMCGRSFPGLSSCNQCHNSGSGVTPRVQISGFTEMEPGEIGRFSLLISGLASSHVAGGLNVSASDGDLLAVTSGGTQLDCIDEITHLAPRMSNSSGVVQFDFDFKAPAVETTLKLQAAGLAVNLNDSTGGDDVNHTSLSIIVRNPPPVCQVVMDASFGGPGTLGSGRAIPLLIGQDGTCDGKQQASMTISHSGLNFSALSLLLLGVAPAVSGQFSFAGGDLYVDLSRPVSVYPLLLSGRGSGVLGRVIQDVDLTNLQGSQLFLQALVRDDGAQDGFALSNGLRVTIQ